MNPHDKCTRYYLLRIADGRQRYLRLDGSGCLALVRRRARASRFCEHLARDLSVQLAPFHGSIELERVPGFAPELDTGAGSR